MNRPSIMSIAVGLILALFEFAGCMRALSSQCGFGAVPDIQRSCTTPAAMHRHPKPSAIHRRAPVRKTVGVPIAPSARETMAGADCLAGTRREQRCLSIRQLLREVATDQPRADARLLGGISTPSAIVADAEHRDIILVGDYDPQREPLRADMLAELWRAVVSSRRVYCSLDPSQRAIAGTNRYLNSANAATVHERPAEFLEGLREAIGPQSVRIGGVPAVGVTAAIMVLADYDMKRVSMGLATFCDVPSTLDISLARAEAARCGSAAVPNHSSMSRFWFRLADGEPMFEESDGVMVLSSCRVVVDTELEIASWAPGVVSSAGIGRDPTAGTFAQEFSNALQTSAYSAPAYGALVDVYRLLACLSAIRFTNLPDRMGLDMDSLLEARPLERVQMPLALPPIANVRTATRTTHGQRYTRTYTWTPIVCGGVDMRIALTSRSFQPVPEKGGLAARAVHDRPTGRPLWWSIGG